MNLFIFFVLPLATILLAIVLQRILRNPMLVAITFFAVYLIVAFTSFSDTLAEALIATIIYTVIAYITAYLVMIICRLRRRFCKCRSEETTNENIRRCGCENNNENTENNLLRISCNCGNSNRRSDLLTIDSNCMVRETDNVVEDVATNLNDTTSRQFASRPVAYGNRRCYR